MILHIERLDQPYKYSRMTECGKHVQLDKIAKHAENATCPKCIIKQKEYEQNEV